jgi:hypothetical protein
MSHESPAKKASRNERERKYKRLYSDAKAKYIAVTSEIIDVKDDNEAL